MTSPARFELIDEFRLTPELNTRLRKLLQASFPESEFTQSRTYLKQLPQRRLLAWCDGELAGQMGIEYRAIGLPTGSATILGVIDLCVAAEHRRRGLATAMVTAVPTTCCGGSRFTSTGTWALARTCWRS